MSKPAPCRCDPVTARSYYDTKGERCRSCGLYRPRPKREPAA